MPSDTFVIVTAHNEAERIGATLAALAQAFPGARVWVADDGSTDATAEIAREAGALVVGSGRVIGKGGAATMAAREALGSEARAERRGRAAGRCASSATATSVTRRALSWRSRRRCIPARPTWPWRYSQGAWVAVLGLAVGFARWAIRRRCGMTTRAPISGQRALSVGVLRDVLPFAHGFGMEVGMTIDAVRAGHRVSEIELELTHRATGRTPGGFAHRARQLIDFVRAYLARR